MRELDAAEMMAIRIALGVEREKLEGFVKTTREHHAQAGYRQRCERVENLLALLAPGATVTVER